MPGPGGRRPGRVAVLRPTSSRWRMVRRAKKPRDVFVYMIAGAKVRAPAAAEAMLERLGKA